MTKIRVCCDTYIEFDALQFGLDCRPEAAHGVLGPVEEAASVPNHHGRGRLPGCPFLYVALDDVFALIRLSCGVDRCVV